MTAPEVPAKPSRCAVPTPALVIDLDVLERNIALMAALATPWGVQLRPHAKSHKCVEIARRQIAAGAIGVSCATLDEVAGMVEGHVPGLLLTSPIAGAAKLARLRDLLQRDPTIRVVADDWAAVSELDALAQSLSLRLGVLVDFDVGQRCTGCRTETEAVELARRIHAAPHLTFEGVQALPATSSIRPWRRPGPRRCTRWPPSSGDCVVRWSRPIWRPPS